jgi:hypothetical protein
LHVREHTGDKHDGGKHDSKVKVRFVEVTSLFLLFFEDSQTVGDETKAGTDPKEQREETSLLVEENNVPWGLAFLGEGVFSSSFEDLSGLCVGQTLINGGAKVLLEVLNIPHMVFPFSDLFGRISGLFHATFFLGTSCTS